jgi:tRNA threonylcarbamoyladenosine biosynthesis protein TsaB
MKAEYNIARMVVLALETVTRQGSVALLIGDTCHARAGDAARTHGERLPSELLALLEAPQLSLRDVDLLAVVAGPGSFTGLRVGMAAVQGLALAAGRRVVAIPTLEVMAEGWRRHQAPGSGTRHTVIACLDGQRGDLFFAVWSMNVADPIERATVLIEPSVGTLGDLARLVGERGAEADAVVVEPGPARHAAGLAALGRVEEVSTLLADTAARMAACRRDQATAPHALRPLYIRRPDAVLARERAGLSRP